MYNTHRGMVPAPNSRLTELLDQLRQEFENQSRSTGEFEHQCMCAFEFSSSDYLKLPRVNPHGQSRQAYFPTSSYMIGPSADTSVA